jgi:hypothetical protein
VVGGLGGTLIAGGSEIADGVAGVDTVVVLVPTVVDSSVAVVGVRNASTTPVISTAAAAAQANAIAAALVRYHGWARTRNISGDNWRPPESVRGFAVMRGMGPVSRYCEESV